MTRLAQRLRLLLVEAGLLAEAAWRWWLGEMAGMIPQRFASGPLIAEFSGSNLVLARNGPAGPVPASAVPGGVVSLRLAPEAVLRRTLKFPVSARFRLRDILANDLDRQSPLDPAAILFTYRILSVERAAARLVVSLVLVRRDMAEAAVAALKDLGLGVQDLLAPDAAGGADRLAPPARPRRRLAVRHRLAAALAVLATCLLAADFMLRAVQNQAVIAQLQSQEARLHQAAARVEDLQTQVTIAQGQSQFLAAQKAQPSLGAIIAAITRLLPDGTWLTGLDFDGQTIEIQGYSSNASNLVAVLDGAKLFTNAGFRAPMTQGPAPNLQQFDLSMTLAGSP